VDTEISRCAVVAAVRVVCRVVCVFFLQAVVAVAVASHDEEVMIGVLLWMRDTLTPALFGEIIRSDDVRWPS
jgi:hypothetical protein